METLYVSLLKYHYVGLFRYVSSSLVSHTIWLDDLVFVYQFRQHVKRAETSTTLVKNGDWSYLD